MDDMVVVYVQDRGPGGSTSLQERVFERHMPAVGNDGVRLGLFIARRLMIQHRLGGALAAGCGGSGEPRSGWRPPAERGAARRRQVGPAW